MKNKLTACLITFLFLFAISSLIWAYQNGRITIFGSENSHQTVFNYNTLDEWNKGEFQNTVFSSNPDFLTARFDYDSSWEAPFSEATSRCDSLTAKCIGGTAATISVSKTGGFAWTNDQVNFYGDGKVIKSSSGSKAEAQKISTCFTAEEMAELLTMIENSGFWTAETPKTGTCTDCYTYKIEINLLDKQKTISWDVVIPSEKIKNLYNTLYSWPDYRTNLVDTNAIPACVGVSNTIQSYSNVVPGCMIDSCKSNPSLSCTTEYDPVCGIDEKTYGNKCEAGRVCAKIACMGKCPCTQRDNCFPKLGWGAYVDYGYYISNKIGSENLSNFQKLEIDPNNIYVPSESKVTFQIAGSKDNYKSWSSEQELSMSRCGDAITDTSRCIDSKYSLNLTDIDQLKDSMYLKVRINYKKKSSPDNTATSLSASQAALKFSPLLSSFSIISKTAGIDTTAPSKVNNIRAADVTQTSIKLAWDAATDDASGIAKYHVYRTKYTGQAKHNDFISVAHADVPYPPNSEIGTTADLSYTVAGLESNTRYQFFVIAEDGSGNHGPYSDILNATTLSSNNSDPNPTISPAPTSIISPWTNISHLVSTGSVLWFNLLLAAIIAGIISYFIFRKRPDY